MRFTKGGYQLLDLSGLTPGSSKTIPGAFKKCKSGKPILCKGIATYEPFFASAREASGSYVVTNVSYQSGKLVLLVATIGSNDSVSGALYQVTVS